jgi:branched-chain amino acid transport system substrate-binding protein
MKQANIDAIYFGGYPTEAGLIVRQARDQGMKAQFIGADALVKEEFWKITGPAGEGTLMTFPPDPRNVPAAWAIVDKFRAEGYDPQGTPFTLMPRSKPSPRRRTKRSRSKSTISQRRSSR